MSVDTTSASQPTATVRSMIVCLSQEIPDPAVVAHRSMLRHFDVTGDIQRRFWPTQALRPWHRRHLVGLQKGKPATCAGGPVRLLDLTGIRHAAGVAAGLRFQQWSQAVKGTRPAASWTSLLAKHRADPGKYPLDKARADFDAQPRVQAMAMHNAAAYTQPRLDLDDLEMFQAGCAAYQHFHALSQICADALLTEHGQQLTPASDSFTDRITYLEAARRHLDTLDPATRVLAITL